MNLSRPASARFDPVSIRLPLIALIDVVLFLLFYFVISYSVSAEESALSSGFATTGVADASGETLVVHVAQAQGRVEYRIGLRSFTERAQLTELLRSMPRESVIVVQAEPSVPIAATAAALQAGKDAGFASVRLAVPNEPR